MGIVEVIRLNVLWGIEIFGAGRVRLVQVRISIIDYGSGS